MAEYMLMPVPAERVADFSNEPLALFSPIIIRVFFLVRFRVYYVFASVVGCSPRVECFYFDSSSDFIVVIIQNNWMSYRIESNFDSSPSKIGVLW